MTLAGVLAEGAGHASQCSAASFDDRTSLVVVSHLRLPTNLNPSTTPSPIPILRSYTRNNGK
jgi:hypothetical protein